MTRATSRRELAASRGKVAREALRRCGFCSHRCGVNRLAGELGPCGAGSQARWCGGRVEVGEEPELCPCYTITLSGCDLRCGFCITGKTSWNAKAGIPLDPAEVAAGAERALRAGARTVEVLGGEPTIHLPSVLELVAHLPEWAHLVYKTNGCCTAFARSLLEGLFDTWLVDYKFGSNACAARLAASPDYIHPVRETLLWARNRSRLIVRHLLMPGHLDCCWKPVARWLAREMPEVAVSLRHGFWPAWRSHRFPELTRPCSGEAIAEATEVARALGLRLIAEELTAEGPAGGAGPVGELLLLPDGRLLVHSATRELAEVLRGFKGELTTTGEN